MHPDSNGAFVHEGAIIVGFADGLIILATVKHLQDVEVSALGMIKMTNIWLGSVGLIMAEGKYKLLIGHSYAEKR